LTYSASKLASNIDGGSFRTSTARFLALSLLISEFFSVATKRFQVRANYRLEVRITLLQKPAHQLLCPEFDAKMSRFAILAGRPRRAHETLPDVKITIADDCIVDCRFKPDRNPVFFSADGFRYYVSNRHGRSGVAALSRVASTDW
jgi:hypothetical protein